MNCEKIRTFYLPISVFSVSAFHLALDHKQNSGGRARLCRADELTDNAQRNCAASELFRRDISDEFVEPRVPPQIVPNRLELEQTVAK